MNSLATLFGLLVLGAVLYLLGMVGIVAVGLVLHALFFDHPENAMWWAMVAWSLFCICFALRGAFRALTRGW
jgi:hypothetical protein